MDRCNIVKRLTLSVLLDRTEWNKFVMDDDARELLLLVPHPSPQSSAPPSSLHVVS